ncbi:MarR family winged helix-turn-helix transcriptional regulator [Microbacterium timonense]|uniref:MarR family winged helix-turn-helix transcriptional regulator n=1 Tax=Microbacterium timonense TaxID=2086576 RepID=UPI000D1103D9|nr:MarR family transcriptional regulator [Microbacterium timonense]
MSTPSSDDPVALWLLWKRAFEHVRAAVVAHVTAHSDLSESELSVLIALREAGGGARQSEVAAALGWDRTRLSHLLTRMETRELITRARDDRAVVVHLLPQGRDALEALTPALEAATRRHLADRIAPTERAALANALSALLRGQDS